VCDPELDPVCDPELLPETPLLEPAVPELDVVPPSSPA